MVKAQASEGLREAVSEGFEDDDAAHDDAQEELDNFHDKITEFSLILREHLNVLRGVTENAKSSRGKKRANRAQLQMDLKNS